MIYAAWHGGASYSATYADDRETFEDMAEALDAFEDRYHNVDGSTPAVDKSASMTIWLYDPRGVFDPYPDSLIEFNDSGEMVVNPC